MLDLEQEVMTAWHPMNNKWYISRGYIYTKRYGELIVKVKDLMKSSNVIISIICDYCGKSYNRRYSDHLKISKDFVLSKDACEECYKRRDKENNFSVYGVEYAIQRKEVREKITESNLEKYGVENILSLKKFKDIIAKTNLEIYGTEVPVKNKDIKQKMKETNNLKYGGNSPSNDPRVRQKQIETTIKKYGVSYSFLNEEVKGKGKLSLYENKTAPTSRQQYYIHKLIGGELNFPHNSSSLDIAFPNEKIYVEIDLGGHELQIKLGNVTREEYQKKEMKRWYALYRKGWREIRIISTKDKIPKDEKILEIIQFAKDYLNNGHHSIKFYLDDGTVTCSQFTQVYDFGELRNIYKKDTDQMKLQPIF
jgi:hypothetical protein